jgi:CRISPR-associated RAMP protein (TIGR02581 family)
MEKPITFFNTITNHVKISGNVEVKTSLHIGSGNTTDSLGSKLPVVRDYDDLPFIPGSSFKGTVRSFCESILRSFNMNNKHLCCDVSSKNWCVTNEEKVNFWSNKNSNQPQDHQEWYEYLDKNLCYICKLFGSPWKQGKINFIDMKVKKESFNHNMYTVRDCTAIDRESGTAKDTSKHDFETIPAGVQFHLSIVATNIEDWELGLLFTSFDYFNNDLLTLGGLKSKGIGHLNILLQDIEVSKPYNIAQEVNKNSFEGNSISEFISEKKKALQQQLKTIQEIRGNNHA